MGDGRLSGLCQTASGDDGARIILFVIMNGGGDLTDGAANRKEHSEVTSLDHVWKIKADLYRPGLFKNRWLCVFCEFFSYTNGESSYHWLKCLEEVFALSVICSISVFHIEKFKLVLRLDQKEQNQKRAV